MSSFILSQLLAGATLLVGMAAFQFRERVYILRGWCLAATLAAIHFYLLGSVTACLLVSVTALRFLLSSFTTDARLMYLFFALAIVSFALTYEKPVNLLALAATLIGTFGSFRRNENTVRYSMLTTEVIWAVHNVIVWSPVAFAMEVLFFTSNLLGLLRHRRANESAL